jgi:hypothetical protein
MVYEMISGLPPFWDDDQAEMLEKICYGCIDNVDWDDSLFTPECKDFIRKVCRGKEEGGGRKEEGSGREEEGEGRGREEVLEKITGACIMLIGTTVCLHQSVRTSLERSVEGGKREEGRGKREEEGTGSREEEGRRCSKKFVTGALIVLIGTTVCLRRSVRIFGRRYGKAAGRRKGRGRREGEGGGARGEEGGTES